MFVCRLRETIIRGVVHNGRDAVIFFASKTHRIFPNGCVRPVDGRCRTACFVRRRHNAAAAASDGAAAAFRWPACRPCFSVGCCRTVPATVLERTSPQKQSTKLGHRNRDAKQQDSSAVRCPTASHFQSRNQLSPRAANVLSYPHHAVCFSNTGSRTTTDRRCCQMIETVCLRKE